MNFIAVSQTLEVAGDAVAAALAADNLICALYFMAIFYVTRKIGPEQSGGNGGDDKGEEEEEEILPSCLPGSRPP